jgi:error-prone DNA polymerase
MFAELVAASNFSFLRGASPADRLVLQSVMLGHTGLGIADRNTVAGVVRAFAALRDLREHEDEAMQARAKAFKLVTGTRLVFCDGTPEIVVYPRNRAGWGQLCRLLTLGNRRAVKGECELRWGDMLSILSSPSPLWGGPGWRSGGVTEFQRAKTGESGATPTLTLPTRGRGKEGKDDLLCILMPPQKLAGIEKLLAQLSHAAPGCVWLGASMLRKGSDKKRLAELKAVAQASGVPLIATNDVLYTDQSQRDLQDILTCIREGVSVHEAGRLLEANAERHLKAPQEMARLFADCPGAIAETQNLLKQIEFSLEQLRYEYPDEPVPEGWTAQAWLEELSWTQAARRYPQGVPAKVKDLIAAELKMIAKLSYAPYFLTVYDIVRVARDMGILCQGRGSAANSAVCYVLGITCVDPAEHNLLFARFISEERREPPDIDVDFEHERREEVIQHIYQRYGRERAGIAATVITYRPKSAIREAGKALGLSEDITAALSGTQWGSFGSEITNNQVRQAGLDPDNPEILRVVHYAKRLLGYPRHLSQHVGGFILSRGRLDELVPIGNAAMEDRTFIEWDKDDIDTLGLMKVDVLALGMLSCIRKAFDYLRDHEGVDYELATVPQADVATYDMLCKGDSIGVFQVESRAQMSMLPRLRPREFYDLVIQVAIVRPGPIQGNMVHPYLRRRCGQEKVSFPSPHPDHGEPDELHKVLSKTMGVPLFQEQAMSLAMVAAKFTDIEANQLRKAMATFRHNGTIHMFEAKMVERMVARGYERDFAERCFEQIKGFGSYGFPESHAASFAKLVYISSWIKCHYPAVFAAALLNSQPMGFYAPAQIVRDAREHGVPVLACDVNYSAWDNALERDEQGRLGLRIGFRQVDGLRREDVEILSSPFTGEVPSGARRRGAVASSAVDDVPPLSLRDVSPARGENGRAEVARRYISTIESLARSGVPVRALRILADADCFRSMGIDRRQALWEIRRLPDDQPLPLFAAADARELAEEPDANLPVMPLGEHVATDYQTLRLSLKAHPMQVLRPIFMREGILRCADLAHRKDASWAKVAGVVLVRQRPGKGNAVFITLEDESGVANVLLWARELETYRRAVMGARLMQVEGRIQKSREGVIHLMAQKVIDRSRELTRLFDDTDPVHGAGIPPARHDHPRDVRTLPRSRDFH